MDASVCARAGTQTCWRPARDDVDRQHYVAVYSTFLTYTHRLLTLAPCTPHRYGSMPLGIYDVIVQVSDTLLLFIKFLGWRPRLAECKRECEHVCSGEGDWVPGKETILCMITPGDLSAGLQISVIREQANDRVSWAHPQQGETGTRYHRIPQVRVMDGWVRSNVT